MSPVDIRMCVADVMQDDVIENLDSILRMLNHPDETSWRSARGASFTEAEVRDALTSLMTAGHVTPCAEMPPNWICSPIELDLVGTKFPWADLWFHLEPSGSEEVHNWWETEGEEKYPNPE